MFLTMFTLAALALSLIGILSGLAVTYGLLVRKPVDVSAAIFFITTIATSVMGFGFPSIGFTRAQAIGVVSLVFLAHAIDEWYIESSWRWVYLITGTLSLYFNVLVLAVQAFQKISQLSGLAPAESERPFVVAQIAVVALFLALLTSVVSTLNRHWRHSQLNQTRIQIHPR